MSEITKYYEKAENNPYRLAQWSQTSRVAFLKEFIKEYTPKGGRILDVGCGDMYLADVLPEYDWSGVDINPDLSKAKAVKQDLEVFPYPFKDAEFDTIICSEVLEHLFNPLAVSKEIRRLIKPTGAYILSTPNLNWIDNFLEHFQRLEPDYNKPWTYEHIHYYSFESHRQILARSQFKIEKFTGADAHFSPFLSQGREVLQQVVEKAYGVKDDQFTKTDQVLGQMFKAFNHTLMFVAKPV